MLQEFHEGQLKEAGYVQPELVHVKAEDEVHQQAQLRIGLNVILAHQKTLLVYVGIAGWRY